MTAPSHPASTDAEIVRAIAAGQPHLFAALMRRHNQRLFRIARAILPDDDDAIDALQEAYVKAYQRLDQLAAADRVDAWLARIVRNEALMARRRRWREVRLDDHREAALASGEAWMTTETRTPEANAALSDLRDLLEASVDGLAEDFREVFVLRAVAGLSVREIGALLDLPDGTVKTRYFRARQALRLDLERRLASPLAALYAFDGARCDRIVLAVLTRLGLTPPAGTPR